MSRSAALAENYAENHQVNDRERNMLLKWLIALRARALLARNVGVGLS
jgi:hypothetical protein